MSFGFQVFNGSNALIIDQDYQNMALRQTGLISALPTASVGNFVSGPMTSYTVTVTGLDSPSVAFDLPVSATGTPIGELRLKYAIRSGSSWTFEFWGRGTITGCKYYVFDVPLPTSLSGKHGLVVFTAAGDVAFFSDYEYMNVVFFGDAAGTLPTVPSGRKYAVSIGSMGVKWYDGGIDPVSGPRWQFDQNFYSIVNSTTLYRRDVAVEWTGSGSLFSSSIERILALDVTGL